MTQQLPTLTSDAVAEVAAFEEFLGRLAVPRPSELVLFQPPLVPEQQFDITTARRGGYYNYPPMGLLFVAAAAHAVRPDLQIKIVDLNHELLRRSPEEGFHYDLWKDMVREALAGCKAPHVGVTYMFGTTKPSFTALTRFLRSEFPEYPILVGGVQASFDFDLLLRSGAEGASSADIVFRKEGELQIQSFLRSCEPEAEPDLPSGAAILHGDAVVQLGEASTDVPVDWDIRRCYDLIDIKNYHRHGSLGAFSHYVGQDKPYATVLSNRGCRARCTFCTVRNFNGFGLRQRPVQQVIDEVKYLAEEKGIRHFDWLDDDLLWDPKRTVELFQGLAEQVPGIDWAASNGLIAVAISDEVMDSMARSGLQAFKIGIESGNDKMLKLIKKPTTKPKLRTKRELFAKYPDVFVSANFIIGFPNETFAQMLDTFRFACELGWDWSSFYICQPLKGTDMFSAFAALGDDRCEEETYDNINPGRASERGEFGYKFAGEEVLRVGWDVFDIPLDSVPSLTQQKEIWFTFNYVANFLLNPCLQPGGQPRKLVRWLEAIHAGYPYDASMAAVLAQAYRLLGESGPRASYEQKFARLVEESQYWQDRVQQFPELLAQAGVTTPPSWFTGEIPSGLTRNRASLLGESHPAS